ncbi:MAG: IS30 family transposase [Lachnospiraceae bacterium]|nr:IS30 family transposase [Lachnospiraceae bacterium]
MGKYLTEMERYKIETMLKDGFTPCQIADRLGKHFTTIYKEIKKGTVTFRNSDWTERKEYCADVAQRKTNENQSNKGRDLKLGSDFELAEHIEHLIKDLHYSPYAVVCDIRKSKRFKTDICKTTLYSYIDKGVFLGISNKDLYSKKNRKNNYEKITRPSYKNKHGKSIEERPKDIKKRKSYGHWEMDTVYSGKNRNKACLLVLTERKFREEYIIKMPDRTFDSTLKALDSLERALGYDGFRERFKTITVDNGSEFSGFELLERSCIYPERKRTDIYYCHPYSSSERGSNENGNKLIRHWINKGEDISKYTDEQIQFIQDWMNNYPRKLFGGLSSNEYKNLSV